MRDIRGARSLRAYGKTGGYLLGAVLAASLGGCSSSQQAKSTAPTNTAVVNCPLAEVPGVRAKVQDVSGGVAIVVAGPVGQLDRIRENVRAMATTNDNKGDPFAPCKCVLQSPGAAETMPNSQSNAELQAARFIPLSTANVEQTPDGATLTLVAKDPSRADWLRTRTREEVSSLRNCLNNAEGATTPPNENGNIGERGGGH